MKPLRDPERRKKAKHALAAYALIPIIYGAYYAWKNKNVARGNQLTPEETAFLLILLLVTFFGTWALLEWWQRKS